MTMTTTPPRYTPITDKLQWASQARRILDLIQESKGNTPPEGEFFDLSYDDCRKLLGLAGNLPSWEGCVFLSRQDALCGPSFVWSLADGPIPETVGHHPFPLGEETGITPHWARANLPQGEYCPTAGFSYSKCRAAIGEVVEILKGWSIQTLSIEVAQYEWARNQVNLIVNHQTGLTLGVVAEGQGVLRAMGGPSQALLEKAAEGTLFVGVHDTHHDRKRPGQVLPKGGYWQYP